MEDVSRNISIQNSDQSQNFEVIVVGAGISGLVALKYCKEAGIDCTLLEASDKVGGLWTYRKDEDYGAMRFTHINVSKYNYCFSDYPFDDSQPEYPSHHVLSEYIKDYCVTFDLIDHIHFLYRVSMIEDIRGEGWKITVSSSPQQTEKVFTCIKLILATGHHVTPKIASFPGLDSFPGRVIHSSGYKDARENGLEGSSVLVVGIGNSAVDAAVDLANHECNVHLSTRSGAWIIPNYIMGYPTDLYASRFTLTMPWKLLNFVFESIVTFILGSPFKWGLNPKMGILQTQPTVSATLVHYLQRKWIKLRPNVDRFDNSRVTFADGSQEDFEAVLMCTGYAIQLDFLEESVRCKVVDRDNKLRLYRHMISPEFGDRLAFLGFLQPSSGGILMCSEVQAQWFVARHQNLVSLPPKPDMLEDMEQERKKSSSRYYNSPRHTIQVDPILYCDQISRTFGGKPELSKHLQMMPRLVFGSCGPAQYRLQGPFRRSDAKDIINRIPIPPLANAFYFVTSLFIIISFLVPVLLVI